MSNSDGPLPTLRIDGGASRLLPLMVAVGLGVTACSQGEASGDVSAQQAKAFCLRQAAGVATATDVREVLTRKHDRYWDVLLGVSPPENLVWCTVNAVNGDVVRWTHGFTRSAAKDALEGGIWSNTSQ